MSIKFLNLRNPQNMIENFIFYCSKIKQKNLILLRSTLKNVRKQNKNTPKSYFFRFQSPRNGEDLSEGEPASPADSNHDVSHNKVSDLMTRLKDGRTKSAIMDTSESTKGFFSPLKKVYF